MKFRYKVYSGMRDETCHGTTFTKEEAISWAKDVGLRHGGGKVVRIVETEETVFERKEKLPSVYESIRKLGN